jgi:hypothetical protein
MYCEIYSIYVRVFRNIFVKYFSYMGLYGTNLVQACFSLLMFSSAYPLLYFFRFWQRSLLPYLLQPKLGQLDTYDIFSCLRAKLQPC